MLKKIKNLLYSSDLKSKVAQGSIFLSGGVFIENGARFIRNIILTRILLPEYFGLMATITAVVFTLEAFSEVGVRQSVIHNKKGGTPEFLNVAWWFSSLRGTILYAIAFLCTPFIADFYNSPELLIPLRITCIVLLFNGMLSPRMHVLEKEMRFSLWVIVKQGSALVGVTSAIILSIYYRNIWPLVLGFIVEYALIFILSYVFVPFRPRFSIDKYCRQELTKYARGMVGLPIFTAIFQRIDVFAIGKLLTMAELGLYSIAQGLAFLPIMAFSKIVRPIVLPFFSKIQNDTMALQKAFVLIIKIIALIIIPVIAFCIIFSEQILSLFYGARYGAVAIPFSILMLYVIIRIFSTVIMQLLFALGRPDLQRNFAFIRVLLGVSLIYPAIKIFGLSGAAMTVFLSMLVLFILQIIWTVKLINIKPMILIRNLVETIWFSAIMIVPCIFYRIILYKNDFIYLGGGMILFTLTGSLLIYMLLNENSHINIPFLKKLKLSNLEE
jgi:O-antigen/teichoic acid export membrane protein